MHPYTRVSNTCMLLEGVSQKTALTGKVLSESLDPQTRTFQGDSSVPTSDYNLEGTFQA